MQVRALLLLAMLAGGGREPQRRLLQCHGAGSALMATMQDSEDADGKALAQQLGALLMQDGEMKGLLLADLRRKAAGRIADDNDLL